MPKDRQITFQRLPAASGSKDDYGEVLGSPVDDLKLWAEYTPVGGREFPASQKRHAETTGRFCINYRKAINPQTVPATHQIVYPEDYDSGLNRTYDIKSIFVNKRRELEIEVSEVR